MKAEIKAITHGKLKGQYRFYFYGDNGKLIGGSGNESYHNRLDALHTIEKYFPQFYETINDMAKRVIENGYIQLFININVLH